MNHCLDLPDNKHGTFFKKIISRVQVFARVTPKQKELAITTFKSLGKDTLDQTKLNLQMLICVPVILLGL